MKRGWRSSLQQTVLRFVSGIVALNTAGYMLLVVSLISIINNRENPNDTGCCKSQALCYLPILFSYDFPSFLQHFFRSGDPNSYYSDPLFFLSTSIHLVLPQNKMHVILLDSDLFFQADIKQLFAQFDKFKSTNIFGLAREQQPVYRHVLHMFRDRHPGTKVGGPPPDGLTGFNSGVVLINLHNMRSSKLYNKLLRGSIVKEIASKYTFQGHLGDQDFYSLLNLDYPELFHVLPCSWNRQLCTWWRDKGYAEVFDSYFNCSEPIHVYHGNCGTKMPNE